MLQEKIFLWVNVDQDDSKGKISLPSVAALLAQPYQQKPKS